MIDQIVAHGGHLVHLSEVLQIWENVPRPFDFPALSNAVREPAARHHLAIFSWSVIMTINLTIALEHHTYDAKVRIN